MEEKKIIVKVSTEDILKGKFADTISAISKAYGEAKGDIDVNQRWSAGAVAQRVERIKKSFEEDLAKLSQSIVLE